MARLTEREPHTRNAWSPIGDMPGVEEGSDELPGHRFVGKRRWDDALNKPWDLECEQPWHLTVQERELGIRLDWVVREPSATQSRTGTGSPRRACVK